jgi:RNA polymerase sigma-70 factor (ECF subfamily)
MTDPLDLDHHGAALRRAARALARDVHAADDLVQDTWVAALEHGAWGEVRARFAWLTTVLRRRATGLRARERFVPLEHVQEIPDERVAQSSAGEQASGAWSEAAVRLTSAVHRLPAADRDVVVRRYWGGQPPRVIAAELGLDVRAVRNRLHRALARLRADLEREGRSLRGLVALLSPEPSLSTAASTALTLLVSMKALTALALIVVTVVLSLQLTGGFESAPRVADAPAPLDRAAERPSLRAPDEAGDALAVAPRPSDRAEATSDMPAVELPAVPAPPIAGDTMQLGQLWVEVVDGATLETTQQYVLQLQLEPADAASPMVVEGEKLGAAKFTAGRYSGAIYRAGRDPHTLGTFTIVPQTVTDLGLVVLQPGGGTLEVAVVGEQGASFSLELFGAGRRRGPCCVELGAERCETCGHRADRSEGHVAASSSFRFERLAAGPYDLVVRDATQRIVASREVVLAPAEARWLEVTLDTKDVEVWLTDADGVAFDGVWLEEGEEFCAPLCFHGWSGEVLSASAHVPAMEAGVRIPSADTEGPVVAPEPRARIDEGQGAPFHAVWPPSLARRPVVLRSEARAERIAPGRYRLVGVPLELDGVQVGCGPYITVRAAVVPEPGHGDTARLRVVSRCMIRSRDVAARPTVTCTTCHVVQEAKR